MRTSTEGSDAASLAMPRQLSSATFNEYGNSLVLWTKTRRAAALAHEDPGSWPQKQQDPAEAGSCCVLLAERQNLVLDVQLGTTVLGATFRVVR
ncbi:hypothetical protein, partial [Escherichia coli]|uniref:hypothetical protein n=1 Tax=Escherichia coli TaxID=562 RepID=UPI0034E449C5